MYWEKISAAAQNSTFVKDNEKYVSFDNIIDPLTDLFLSVKKENKCVYFIGNGGSAGIAVHMTADFMKNGGMSTVSLYNPSVITCLSNDIFYDAVFAEQIRYTAPCMAGSLLVAISSSGESPNIWQAVQMAKSKKFKVLTLSGFKEDSLLNRSSLCRVHVPSMEYGIVESLHNMILQQVVDELMKRG